MTRLYLKGHVPQNCKGFTLHQCIFRVVSTCMHAHGCHKLGWGTATHPLVYPATDPGMG